MARKPKTLTPSPTPEPAALVQNESAPAAAESPSTVDRIINLKKATREYGAELCDLCPPSSHAALLVKLEHVRENAELAIRSGGR